MLNFRLRTEYSFGEVYGPLDRVLARCAGASHAAITDRGGTWGHVQWRKKCKAKGIKPIYGAELAVVTEEKWNEKRQDPAYVTFLATDSRSLVELYELVTHATAQAKFRPRLRYSDIAGVSQDLEVLVGSFVHWEDMLKIGRKPRALLAPSMPKAMLGTFTQAGLDILPACDNFFPAPQDFGAFEIIAGDFRESRADAMHILEQWEWDDVFPAYGAAHSFAVEYAARFTVDLPTAEMVHFNAEKSLAELCRDAAPQRGVDLTDGIYAARLQRELELIHEKKFEDYFYVIADMLQFAKTKMLVGPARGSSCGSLVCYLLSITEIDPIPHNLLFERFIDINRQDLPDIDIDFPDTKRDLVFDYMRTKYGADCVVRLGTIGKFKAKSAIGDVAKALNIPQWEVQDLKNSIIERSTGDSRAAFCIADTFEQLDVGKNLVAKYPGLLLASKIEAHASHAGQHAAGIVVTAEPVKHYCSVDMRTGAAMVDKYDAESLNLLKIDALGLRTLSVIEDCLEQIGWTYDQIIRYPLTDTDAFAVINAKRFAGVFQFEGFALQSLCNQMRVERFEDISALTALARPGPLSSGGTAEWLKRRTGKSEVKYLHPLLENITKETLGIVIFQEDVLRIGREFGELSWEDVSSLRKAMSKSLGKEFFEQYWLKFKQGSDAKGVPEEESRKVWDNINTMGSWAFNKSHSVAYGLVSYWCCVLKAHHPLEWAAACLRHAKDDDQSIKLLRELHKEGFKYKAFDPERSRYTWTVQDGELIGGLMGVKGIGEKTAQDISARRERGEELTGGQKKKLANAVTPYDMIFECRERWGHIIDNPLAHNILTPISEISSITNDSDGSFLIIGKLTEKNLRDHNEVINLQKRGGKKMDGQSLFLNINVEDDTGTITCGINRFKYLQLGKPIVEEGKIGDWYLIKGINRRGFRRLAIERVRKLS